MNVKPARFAGMVVIERSLFKEYVLILTWLSVEWHDSPEAVTEEVLLPSCHIRKCCESWQNLFTSALLQAYFTTARMLLYYLFRIKCYDSLFPWKQQWLRSKGLKVKQLGSHIAIVLSLSEVNLRTRSPLSRHLPACHSSVCTALTHPFRCNYWFARSLLAASPSSLPPIL